MDGFNEKLNAIKLKFSNRCDDIEQKLTHLQDEMDEMKVILDGLVWFKDQQERAALQNETCSKRQNILIHGIEEDEKSIWESRDITTQKLKNLMKMGSRWFLMKYRL